MAIMGGTGEFAMARGVIKFRTVKNTAHESYKQLDIHTFYVLTRVSEMFLCLIHTPFFSECSAFYTFQNCHNLFVRMSNPEDILR